MDNFLRFPIDNATLAEYIVVMKNTTHRQFCKTCKTMTLVADGYEIDWMQVVPRIVKSETRYGKSPEFLRHECGNFLRGTAIIAKSGKQECGAKCTSAIGPACECKCKGEMHGIGSAA